VSNDKRAADDAEREAFEAWANERELDLMPGYPGQYSDCNTDFAWDAWQARAALSSRADGGKDSSDAALDALKRAERFIVNGTEFGYIRMPDAPDPALDTLPAIRKAIDTIAKEQK
jgi:hypothetical protein